MTLMMVMIVLVSFEESLQQKKEPESKHQRRRRRRVCEKKLGRRPARGLVSCCRRARARLVSHKQTFGSVGFPASRFIEKKVFFSEGAVALLQRVCVCVWCVCVRARARTERKIREKQVLLREKGNAAAGEKRG